MSSVTPHSNQESERKLSILIVRASAIGDVLMVSPVAQALREAYPHAHIAWAVEPLSAPLVEANPYVDEVIPFELTTTWRQLFHQHKFLTLFRAMRTFTRTLREHQFDLAVDCHGLLKSGLVSWFTRAPRRIGPTPVGEGNQLFMTESASWAGEATHLADRYLAILAPLGIPAIPRRPVLTIPTAIRDAAKAFLTAEGLSSEEPYVACCVSSTRLQKDWVWERWGELADRLWERHHLRTVLIGGPERKEDAARLVAARTSRPISAVGKLPLLQSAAIVQGAKGIIGVDTGLTYAGMANDVPTVALYGSTDATWLTEEPQTTICLHTFPCAPCNRHPKCRDFDCMRSITVEEAVDALQRLLANQCTTV